MLKSQRKIYNAFTTSILRRQSHSVVTLPQRCNATLDSKCTSRDIMYEERKMGIINDRMMVTFPQTWLRVVKWFNRQ